MVISKIEEQKRKGRFNIYVDGNFWSGLSSTVLVKYNLYQGKEVDPGLLGQVYNSELFSKFYDRAISKIARRPHSIKEVTTYLREVYYKKRKDWFSASKDDKDSEILFESISHKIIKKMKSQGLLSDEAFAAWFVKNRMDFRPRGWYKIKTELLQKGVSLEVISGLEIGLDKEVTMAQKVYDKLVRTRILPKEKIISRLQYRGFSWDVIEKILKENNIE